MSQPYQALPLIEPAWISPVSTKAEPLHLRQASGVRWALRFWVTTSMFLALLSAYLGSQLYLVRHRGSFAHGFKHELGAAKNLIKIEERLFEGSPRFLEDGTEYVPGAPDGQPRTQYVGDPSEEIDNAWDRLHQGRFFFLSESEAREAWGPGYEQFYMPELGGYVTELEVTHVLHCLDHIRKAFYPSYYPPDSDLHGIMHRDHCLDHLRQMALCNSDLTPIPTRFYNGINNNYIDSDRPHTCRNWPSIRDWMWERYNGSLAVLPAQRRPS